MRLAWLKTSGTAITDVELQLYDVLRSYITSRGKRHDGLALQAYQFLQQRMQEKLEIFQKLPDFEMMRCLLDGVRRKLSQM